jgi:hypothetical protein
MAKPTYFSEELFDTICDRIADGESLRGICREKEMPSTTAFMRWVANDASLVERYTRARTVSGDADADDMKDIAMRVVAGEIEPNAGRVAIDALKWSAGKRRPMKYGDKISIDAKIEHDFDGAGDALAAALKRVKDRSDDGADGT